MRFVFLSVLLILTGSLYCQELSYKQFASKDGLPGSVIYHALQDRKGFIWFATRQGVSCFDGHTFRNYTKEDGLPDNDIIKLYLDKNDNVWCVSFVGIPAVFRKGSVIRFEQCTGVTAIVEDRLTDSIQLIAEISNVRANMQGYYASPNRDGQWVFSPRLEAKHLYAVTGLPVLKLSSPDAINFRFSFYERNAFSLMLDNGRQVTYYGRMNNDIHRMSLTGNASMAALTKDKKGIVFNICDTLYYATFQKMTAIMPLRELGLTLFSDINYLFCENDSTLWVCTRSKGLLCIKNFLTDKRRVTSFFTNSFCTSILKDHEQGYWVTTQGQGVYYLPNLSFYTLSQYPSSMLSKNALCIGLSHPQTLTAGFADGNFAAINYLQDNSQPFDAWATLSKNNRVLQILPLPGHAFLLGCDNGLYRYTAGKTVKLRQMAIKEMYAGKNDQYFVGSSEGVYRLDVIGNISELVYRGRITCLTGRADQLFWGTLRGVYSYQNGTTRYMGDRYPALTSVINHLDLAPDSALWISTQQGVAILKDGRVTQLSRKQGMPGNMCKHVSFEGDTAWVATDKGIARVSYQWKQQQLQYTLSTITEEDGLPSNEVNQTVVAGDYVWAATGEGIGWFPKNYVSHPVSNPRINITGITAGGLSLPVTDTIQVAVNVNSLRIGLSGISYRSGKQVWYEYRLKGIEEGWSTLQNNAIEFSSLPAGQFTFEVRAVDRWRHFSDQPARLVIIHPPPFWRTNWFLVCTYLLMAVLLGTGFYLYYRRRQRKQEEEYRFKRKMHELEMMALRAQMNPHFIFNCLTSIQYHVIRADVRSAYNYLHKFSTLIRQILQYSTESVISLREEIKLLELYLELEKLRLGDRMEYQLRVDHELLKQEYSLPAMIVQPHVENAIKHGIAPLQDRKGLLTIDFRKAGEYIEVVIEDNGPGIHAPVQPSPEDGEGHVSMGVDITARRINALNAIQKNKIRWQVIDKQESGQPASGTIILLSFPVTS